jgi:phosphotransferase system  glucose/maltose/N-acetylglucosamine-specific IIC component
MPVPLHNFRENLLIVFVSATHIWYFDGGRPNCTSVSIEGKAMFKIIMIIAVAGLAIAWIIYAIYDYKLRQEEKKQPKQSSERLKKTRSEVADWAKKLVEFKPPTRKKPGEQDKQ